VKAIENAGPDLTTQKLVEGMEKIRNYQDIFGGPPQGFAATEHVSSREAVIYRVEKDVGSDSSTAWLSRSEGGCPATSQRGVCCD
jgi:hypothetical protein